MKFLQSTRNKIYAGIAVVLGLFMPTHFAFALFGISVSGLVVDLIVGILWLVEKIFAGIAWLASFIMKLGSDLLLVSIKVTVIEFKAHIDLSIINTLYDVMRNFANTFFIFILIYLAIKIILNAGEFKRLLVTLMISAVLVNFSYFFTTLIIDTSNIVATGFFNKIDLSSTGGSLGDYIVESLELDKLEEDGGNPSDFNSAITGSATSSLKNPADSGGFFDDDELEQIYAAVANVLFSLFLIFFYAIAAYIFLDAAFLFLGRYVAFIFLIILAPIAFASYAMPRMKERIWNKWFQHLTNQAFVAPIFLFFIYVIVQVLGSTMKVKILAGTTNPVVSVVLFFVIVIGLLQLALTVSREFAGEIGSMASKYGKVATGKVAGTAAGLAAYGGRRTGGALGTSMKSSGRLNQLATSDNILARGVGKGLTGVGRKLSSSSFDLRSAPGISGAASMGGLSLGAGKTGGYEAYRKQRVEKNTTLENERLDTLKQQAGRHKGLEKMEADGKTLTAGEQAELKKLSNIGAKDAYSKAIGNLEERSRKQAGPIAAGSFKYEADSYERESLQKATSGRIKNEQREARKEASEKEKDQLANDISEFSDVLKSFSSANSGEVRNKLENTPTKVVVQGLSQNTDMLNNSEFASLISGKLANDILKNKNFVDSSTPAQRSILENKKDKASSMEPTKFYSKDGGKLI